MLIGLLILLWIIYGICKAFSDARRDGETVFKDWLAKKVSSTGMLSIVYEANLLSVASNNYEAAIISCKNEGLFQSNNLIAELIKELELE